jgi:hypothetical protein
LFVIFGHKIERGSPNIREFFILFTMHKHIYIILLMLLPGILTGQTAGEKVTRMKDGRSVREVDSLVDAGRTGIDWDLSLGSGFMFMPGGGSGMMLHAAPMMTVPLTGRWSLHAGVAVMQFRGPGYSLMNETTGGQVFSSLALFAAASCRMNDRLVLHGTGVKQLVSAPLAPYATPDHFSLGATYRLGDNITIGASIHMDRGNRYLYPSSFDGGGFYAPFGGGGAFYPYYW